RGRPSMESSSWQLTSSSGREWVRWDLQEVHAREQRAALICDIHLEGQYFGAALGGEATGVRDYHLLLGGLAIGRDELERLSLYLRQWLQLPLAQQARRPPALTCNVGGLFDQSLTMTLGQRDDTLSGGRPVATFRYIVGRLTGELSFVTDQSCL